MFTAKLAEHLFDIDNKYDYIERYYKDYITVGEAEYTISASEEEIAAENFDNGGWSMPYLETLAVYRKICETLLPENVVLFHCSALEIDGRAILFTAPSGTGKSTHARLWRERFNDRVTMINDDKPLLHISWDVTVYGTPYGGKHCLQTNKSADVAAIVILHQAKDNSIARITAGEAFPTLLNQTYRSKSVEAMTMTLPLVDKLAHLPVYSLGCNISHEAAELVYNTVFGNH